MAKFKVGDMVMVRSDLIVGDSYGDNVVAKEMLEWKGKVVTIQDDESGDDYGYNIKEDGQRWSWTNEMFVGTGDPNDMESDPNG